MLGVLTFTTFPSVFAGTLLKCSLNKRPQTVSGINVFLDGKSTASGKLFFRASPGVELGQSDYTRERKTERYYYGSDINRPAGTKESIMVSSSFFAERYSAKVEIRLEKNSSTATGYVTVLDEETYIARNQRIICDVTEND